MIAVLFGNAGANTGLAPSVFFVCLGAGAAFLAAGLMLLLPSSSPVRRKLGAIFVFLGVGSYLTAYAGTSPNVPQVVFWLLATWTVVTASLSVAMPSAVYAAVWFAASLVGVAGLLLYVGAQFLGVVTIVIYAGAIVVMFLFVIMLAQPRGRDVYDRLTWSNQAKILTALVAGIFPALFIGWSMPPGSLPPPTEPLPASSPAFTAQGSTDQPTAGGHTVLFGRDVFSRYLIHVELAGTLLLAALIGAVAMVLYGRTSQRMPEAHRHE